MSATTQSVAVMPCTVCHVLPVPNGRTNDGQKPARIAINAARKYQCA